MIGNDLIYLPDWYQRSERRQEQFLKRITFPEEETLLPAWSTAQNTALLWSIKEATYKAWHRESDVRCFQPRSIRLDMLKLGSDLVRSIVDIKGVKYFLFSNIAERHIHTISRKNDGSARRYPSHQIQTERPQVIRVNGQRWQLKKDAAGRPILEQGTRRSKRVSLSHDGPLFGLAYLFD